MECIAILDILNNNLYVVTTMSRLDKLQTPMSLPVARDLFFNESRFTLPEAHQSDRRPIKTRDAVWAQRLSSMLVRSKVTANGISIAGMVSGILAGICFACTVFGGWFWVLFVMGVLFVQGRLIANMLDGMVAIESKTSSPVGELYNEIPDRVSDTATLIGCGYALGGSAILGYWATILALFLAYIRAAGRVAGAPQIYAGPMAKQHRMFVVTVFALLSTVLPQTLVSNLFQREDVGWMAIALLVIIGGEVLTVFRRLWLISKALRSKAER